MNPDLANLLAALRDQPHDEVAYLALADWCLEQPAPQTQARGEHVRLSLRLGKLPRNDPEAFVLRDRVKALGKRHRAAWLGTLRHLAHRCDFLPGGLVKVELTDGRLELARTQTPRIAPPTAEEFAWVTSLTARTRLPVASLRWLAGLLPEGFVRSYHVCHGEEPAGDVVEALSRCRWLAGLRVLGLSGGRLGDGDIALLIGLLARGELRELNLSARELTSTGFAALARSPNLARLGRLAISHCSLQAVQGAAVTPAAWTDSLRSLALDCCCLGAAELAALLTPTFAAGLVELSLQNNAFASQAVRLIASWPGMARVRVLRMGRNAIDDEGLMALAQSPHLGELRELGLGNNCIGNPGLIALAASAALPRLAALDITGNEHVGGPGLLALCRSQTLPALRTLHHGKFGLSATARKALWDRFKA